MQSRAIRLYLSPLPAIAGLLLTRLMRFPASPDGLPSTNHLLGPLQPSHLPLLFWPDRSQLHIALAVATLAACHRLRVASPEVVQRLKWRNDGGRAWRTITPAHPPPTSSQGRRRGASRSRHDATVASYEECAQSRLTPGMLWGTLGLCNGAGRLPAPARSRASDEIDRLIRWRDAGGQLAQFHKRGELGVA